MEIKEIKGRSKNLKKTTSLYYQISGKEKVLCKKEKKSPGIIQSFR